MYEQDKNLSQRYDEFVERMLITLFELGLMPMSLGKAPSEFEKYPQRLLTLLRTTRDASRAFAVWRSEVLRKAKTSKEAAYPELAEFGHWMQRDDNRQMLESPTTIRHLRQSMYGRSFDYLYPRLALIYEYRDACLNGTEAMQSITVRAGTEQAKELCQAVADEKYVRQHFAERTQATQKHIEQAYGREAVEPLLEAAIAFLLQNPNYFNITFTKR